MSRKILVVEDDESLLQLLSTVFSLENYEVFSAVDGEEALRIAREESPEIILLDAQLPKTDGYEVCKLIKSNANMKNIKVIMLSGMKYDYAFSEARKVGADAFIKKPFSPTLLVEKVKELLRSDKQGEFGDRSD